MMHIVDMTSSAPTVTHVIPGDKVVTGVASLGDDVFIVRAVSPQVEVYDAETFTLQRRLLVPGLGCSYGLAACASNKCLYASDYSHDLVHRVDLLGSNAVTQWTVGSVSGPGYRQTSASLSVKAFPTTFQLYCHLTLLS